MPLYVYECPRCHAREEKVCSVVERDRAVWCDCGDVYREANKLARMKRVEFPGSNFTIEEDYV